MSKKRLNRRKALFTILSLCFIVPGVAVLIRNLIGKLSSKPNSNSSPNLKTLTGPQSRSLLIIDQTGQESEKTISIYSQELNADTILELVKIEGGKNQFGSDLKEIGHLDSEEPKFLVTIPEFYMSLYPITQEQWEAVMGDNPSTFQGQMNLPVETVSWDDAQKFCEELRNKTGKNYRLPSETEWEYACRADTITPFYFGNDISFEQANYDTNYDYAYKNKIGSKTSTNCPANYLARTTPVGEFRGNQFGLYDMHGNVWEWCEDAWMKNHSQTPHDGTVRPHDPNKHKQAVIRGGSWHSFPARCRSAAREGMWKNMKSNRIGFRVVREI